MGKIVERMSGKNEWIANMEEREDELGDGENRCQTTEAPTVSRKACSKGSR